MTKAKIKKSLTIIGYTNIRYSGKKRMFYADKYNRTSAFKIMADGYPMQLSELKEKK
jgi:hypothetical protein